MNIKRIINDFIERISLREGDEETFLIMPIFHRYENYSITLKFYMEGEYLYISDCGSTFEYLDNRYLYPEDYREIIEKVKKRFFIKEKEKGELFLEFPSDQIISIEMFMWFFLQGISIIANVDLY